MKRKNELNTTTCILYIYISIDKYISRWWTVSRISYLSLEFTVSNSDTIYSLLCTCCDNVTLHRSSAMIIFLFFLFFIRGYTVIDTLTHQYTYIWTLAWYVCTTAALSPPCSPITPWNNHRQFIMLFTTCFAYIYIYIYIYICVRVYIHTYTHIFFVHAYIYICIYIYVSSSLSHIEKHIEKPVIINTFK